MYKLVAIDLDGTLLDSKQRITETNISAIQSAIRKGVRIVICSGRIFKGARIFARQFQKEGPIITCNGALIKELGSGTALYSNFLGLEDAMRIIDICHRQGVYFHMYAHDVMYAEKLEFGSSFYYKMNAELPDEDRVDIRIVEDMGEELQSNPVEVSKFVIVSQDPELLLETRNLVLEIPTIEVMSSGRNNFEAVNRGVNKGVAIRLLSEQLGISREEIIAIGDNENDCSMIEYAGLGVAMGNAEDFVKEMADFVTLTNNDSGVGEVLKKFVLQHE